MISNASNGGNELINNSSNTNDGVKLAMAQRSNNNAIGINYASAVCLYSIVTMFYLFVNFNCTRTCAPV